MHAPTKQSSMIPLAIATCRPLPEPDPDEGLLVGALRDAGIDARMTPWRDDLDGTVATPTLIRSTWDYVRHYDEFLSWVDAAERRAPLWNPARVVRSNLHKRYLLDLERRGVPATPTELVDRGDARSLVDVAADRGWREVVIKPAIGAGSFETHRGRASDPVLQARFARLVAACDVLVQAYLDSVEGHGERALVWIDGAFTHAVRKSPRFAADSERVSGALAIAADERAVGEAALEDVADGLLYARVDVAPGPDGRPVVMEVELVEPSLFLLQEPRALERLVAGILRRLRG
jgi:hypothetical protein